MWDLALRSAGGLAARRAAADAFNAGSRFRKRGLAAVPTKFGISFTTKFLNQARARAKFGISRSCGAAPRRPARMGRHECSQRRQGLGVMPLLFLLGSDVARAHSQVAKAPCDAVALLSSSM